MKRILKRLCVVATALAMSFGLSQCAKDNDTFIETPEGQVYVTLTASKGEMTKTSLEQNTDNDLVVKWTTGDKLYAVGETDGLLGSLVLTDGDGMTSGKFGGNINYLTSKQNVRFYYVGKNKSITDNTYTLNLDNQVGTLASIAENMHVMVGTLNNVAATTVNFGAVTMSNIISIVKVDTKTAFGEVSGIKLSGSVNNGVLDLKTGTVTPTSGDITLTDTATNSYYIALLANGAEQTFNFEYDSKNASLEAKTIVAGKYYTDSGDPLALVTDDGSLPGLFSVSPTKKVQFSKGNLRYSLSTGQWGFFEHQYDCGPSTYAAGHNSEISLFTWGYNATNSIVPNGQHYDNVGITSGNLIQEQDWGCTIGDGLTWSTLSTTEWAYLLGTSTERSEKYKLNVTVCGKTNCLVIAPDNFTGTIDTYYDVSTWADAEADGLVCLPPAGTRDGESIEHVTEGFYWSSTANNDTKAYDMYYSNSTIFPSFASGERGKSCSVRLVKEALPHYFE